MSAMGDMRDYMRPSTSTSSNEQIWKTNNRKVLLAALQHRMGPLGLFGSMT
jgi:hypothetical protein